MIGNKNQYNDKNHQTNCLLQEIQQASLCYYLSDLHFAYNNFNAGTKESISNIPNEKYTLAEWNEAVEYITGVECKCSTILEVKEKFNNINK